MKQLPEPESPGREMLPSRYQYVEVPPPEAAEPEGPTLLDYWRTLMRNKGTLALFALGGVAAALLFSLPQTPVYQAKMTLEALNLNQNVLNRSELEPTEAPASSPDLDIRTQVRILQSESLVERVLADWKTKHAPPAERSRIAAWREALGLKAPENPKEAQDVKKVLARLKATVVPQTRLVEVKFDSVDPQEAAGFLNALADKFIEQNMEARWQTTQATGAWLTRQLQDLKIKLERAEDELQQYARTAGLLFTAEKDNVAEEKLRQVQEELSKAQADRVAKQARYEQARNAPPETLPEILEDTTLARQSDNLTDLRRELADLETTLTPSHPKVRKVRAQIATLEATFERQRRNVLERIRNEFQAAERREKLLARDYAAQSKVVSDQAQRAVHYNILKREVDTQRSLYEAMLQKVREYGIASAMQASNVRVVDKAKPPRFPYKPNYPLNGALGLLLGGFLGTGFVLIRERADRTIQAPGEISLWLDAPELGVIPCGHARRFLSGYYPRRADREADKSTAVELATVRHSGALLAESFRGTLTSILFSARNGDAPRVIVFTSPNPREGKSTMVSNLGLALAEIRRRVVVVDADLRKPRQHEIFGTPNSAGLSELLSGELPAEEYRKLLLATAYPGLFVLPAGKGSPSAANLLYSPRLRELLERLREEFDAVLVDTPPVLTMPDARVVGRLSDGVVLVVRSRQTTRDMAQAAAQRLAEDGTPLLGTVLNDWDPKASSRGYYGYYRGYYYRPYGHYYRSGGSGGGEGGPGA
jgi:capsular exopolysaccharide synthesis family protein